MGAVGMRKCPFCAEEIEAEAPVCRFCGARSGGPACFPSCRHRPRLLVWGCPHRQCRARR